MINTLVPTTPILVLPAAETMPGTGTTRARWVVVKNPAANTNTIFLSFDGVISDLLPVTSGAGCGYDLVPGDSITFSPVAPKGSDGTKAIYAVSPGGAAWLHIQFGEYEQR